MEAERTLFIPPIQKIEVKRSLFIEELKKIEVKRTQLIPEIGKSEAKKRTGSKLNEQRRYFLTINVPVVYMGRYEVVLRGDYP